MKNIGLYFGSFNPIHNAHITIANECLNTGLDEVWFVLSPRNPFKPDAKFASFEDRAEMISSAIDGCDRMRLCTIEGELGHTPSYTYITLSELHRRYPGYVFTIIVGYDNFSQMVCWKNYQEIVTQHPLIVLPRDGVTPDAVKGYQLTIEQSVHASISVKYLTGFPEFHISSTEIRKRIRQGKLIYGFTPKVVIDYIQEHHLYQD